MLRFAQHDRMEGHDKMEDVAPSPLSLSPRVKARGPSVLTHLGMTRWEVVSPSPLNSKSILIHIPKPVF